MDKPTTPLNVPLSLLTERQCAACMGISPYYLNELRIKEGLPYLLMSVTDGGREFRRYDWREVEKWLDARRRSDPPPKPPGPRQRIDERIKGVDGVPGWDGIDRIRGRKPKGPLGASGAPG